MERLRLSRATHQLIERDGDHITPNGDTQVKQDNLVSAFSPETLPEQLVNAFDSEP